MPEPAGANGHHGRPGPQAYPTIDAMDWEGHRILARVDINSPVQDGRPVPNPRLEAAATSLQALLDAGAGVVALGHQGRPGREDFTSLEHHAEELSELLDREVAFTPHVDNEDAVSAATSVAPGEVLLLENVRGAPGEIENVPAEQHAQRPWVTQLADVADGFLSDAFPVCHRSHASVAGFPLLLPSALGPVAHLELTALAHVTDEGAPAAEAAPAGPRVLVLGGAKVEDALKVLEHHLAAGLIDQALCGGLLGELFLIARGHTLGVPTDKVLERAGAMGYLSQAEELLFAYDPYIVTPLDVAFTDAGSRRDIFIEELPAKGQILDIGPESAEVFAEHIQAAESVVLNGPMGAYERAGFALGTERVVQACAETEAYTLLGGGHTVASIEAAGIDRSAFDHVSLAGGALVTYLTGEPLPGLRALETSARKFALAP